MATKTSKILYTNIKHSNHLTNATFKNTSVVNEIPLFLAYNIGGTWCLSIEFSSSQIAHALLLLSAPYCSVSSKPPATGTIRHAFWAPSYIRLLLHNIHCWNFILGAIGKTLVFGRQSQKRKIWVPSILAKVVLK